MTNTTYITGFRKSGLDAGIFLRFLWALIIKHGPVKGFRLLKSYLQHKNNLFSELPDRYVRVGKNIYVVPDVPPLGSRKFTGYLLNDVAVLTRGHEPPLLFGMVCISSVCPYRCSYCYNINEHNPTQLLSEDLLLNTIDEFIKAGAGNIYLTGGEPLMRKAFIFTVLKKFSGSDTGFWLITTGHGMDNSLAAALKQQGLRGVMISLDDCTPERINGIKSPQAFDNACKALRAASAAGLVTVADCVMSSHMLKPEYFRTYLQFATSLGVHFVNMYVPRTAGTEADSEIKPFTLNELILTGQLSHTFLRGKANRQLPLAYSPDAFEAKRGCMGGRLFFYISPDGSVKACPFQKSILGNIKNDTLTNIINTYKKSGVQEICESNRLLRAHCNEKMPSDASSNQ